MLFASVFWSDMRTILGSSLIDSNKWNFKFLKSTIYILLFVQNTYAYVGSRDAIKSHLSSRNIYRSLLNLFSHHAKNVSNFKTNLNLKCLNLPNQLKIEIENVNSIYSGTNQTADKKVVTISNSSEILKRNFKFRLNSARVSWVRFWKTKS